MKESGRKGRGFTSAARYSSTAER
uniref:Uncharacterized protein n=1 Tax=Arundo donax TaxID=35708 RepID=A0A0A9GTP3_ARUDO